MNGDTMQYNMTIRRKNKGYQVIVSFKDGRKWRQKSKQGFDTKRDAKMYGLKMVDKLKSTVITIDSSKSDVTFLHFYNIYINEKANITENTRRTYTTIINSYCQSLLNKAVGDITHQDIIQLLNELPRSSATKNLCLVLLKSIFNYAINPYRIISHSPCAAIKRFKSKANNSPSTISQNDMNLLLYAIKRKHPMYYLLCSIARYTGARYGEILALTWDDIDLINNTISISKQWTWLGNAGYGFSQPKSRNSIRTIPIPEILADELIWHIGKGNERLFPFKTNRSSPLNRVIQRYLPDKSIHSFRHTYATTLLANGVDIQTVASLLGDKLNTVMTTYIHYSDDMRKQATNHIASIFG